MGGLRAGDTVCRRVRRVGVIRHVGGVPPQAVERMRKPQMDTDSTLQTGKRDLKNRQRSCPGWTCDNSPTFQRWVDQCRDHQVPKGRLKRRAIPQPSLRDWTAISLVLPNVETLGYCRASLRDEEQT